MRWQPMFTCTLGLISPGGSHRRGEILTDDLAGLYRDHSFTALLYREPNNRQQNHDDGSNQRDFFPVLHRSSIPVPSCCARELAI